MASDRLIRRRGLGRDERGSVLTEYAFVIPLFLALLFAVIDFGRIFMVWVLAEKATHHAVRVAAVRPAVCAGVPDLNARAAGNTDRFGTSCAALSAPCTSPGPFTCPGNAGNATFAEIFADVAPLLPSGAAPANFSFTYQTTGLGFLGGPYIPTVTVELTGLTINYLTPFAQLLRVYGATGGIFGPLTLPPMRATMPGEDLNVWTLG
jgi:Flp pilus assembly protein TadG